MKQIIDNLSRQHRDLIKTATRLFGWLDPTRLAQDAREAHKHLSSLTGILTVHLSMEDASLYPRLLQHRDADLRTLARGFLDERSDIKAKYEQYKGHWPTASAIERSPQAFIDQTREILGLLWSRMKREDDELHPVIVVRMDGED